MEPLAERLDLILRHIQRASSAVEALGDRLSPVLVAVVQEFQRKAQKLRAVTGRVLHDTIIEVEQAADSARVAVAADPATTPEIKQLVGVAHDSICLLKHEQ